MYRERTIDNMYMLIYGETDKEKQKKDKKQLAKASNNYNKYKRIRILVNICEKISFVW